MNVNPSRLVLTHIAGQLSNLGTILLKSGNRFPKSTGKCYIFVQSAL